MMSTPTDKRQDAAEEAAIVARRRAFLAAAHSGHLARQVALVLPVARRHLLAGGMLPGELPLHVGRLVGDDRANHGAEWPQHCDALSAAFALGLAFGQQVRPGFFEGRRRA